MPDEHTEERNDEDRMFKRIWDFVSRWSASHRIRFGGVVGKIAYIAVACVIGATAVVMRSGHDAFTLMLVVLFLGFGCLVIWGILRYADRHPEIATLEGSEVLQ
jgi:Ca2+/Na+ antiporter